MTVLHHYSLSSGKIFQVERIPKVEESAWAIRELVLHLVGGDPDEPELAEVPLLDGYYAWCSRHNGPPLFRILGPVEGPLPVDDDLDLPTVVSFGVVIDDEDGAEDLWCELWGLDPRGLEPPARPTADLWSASVAHLFEDEAAPSDVWRAIGHFQKWVAWTLWSIRHDVMH